MDIRYVTDAEKESFFYKAKEFFSSIRNVIDTLEKDIYDEDLEKQAASVWVTGNMAVWYGDFMDEIRKIHLQKEEIQKQMSDYGLDKEKLDD